MNSYTIDRSENGFTVYRSGQAIATYETAGEAIEAMRKFRERPARMPGQTMPPAIAAFKARLQAERTVH